MKNSGLHKHSDSSLADVVPDSREFESFIAANRSRDWLTLTLKIDEIDPLAYIEQMNDESDLFYWEQPDQQFSLVSGGSCVVLRATGSDRFGEIGRLSQKLAETSTSYSTFTHSLAGPRLMGGYSFTDYNIRKEWQSFGAARFVLPVWTVIKSGKLHLLTLTVPMNGNQPDDIYDHLSTLYKQFLVNSGKIRQHQVSRHSKDEPVIPLPDSNYKFTEWQKQVEQAKQLIHEGTFKKIVIAREQVIRFDSPIRYTKALYYLREHFPGCTIFLNRSGTGPAFIGATPERLVSLQNRRILTEGLAGSVPRGESASDDVALENLLIESPKERLEHDYVVRDIRNSLAPFSRNLEHPRRPQVKKLKNVQHLFTPISAQSNGEVTLHDLAGQLHPTPAVGGYPRSQAVPYINNIESIDRGWYAGPIGWYHLNGNGEFSVAIRSALVNENSARLYAGCGIVAESDPTIEWMETEMKLRPLLNALMQST